MSKEADYYKILGINSESSDSEIKKAYRGLSMKYHPDRNVGNSQVEEKFKEINQAYEILGDKEARRRYDLTKNNPFLNFSNNSNMRVPVNPDDFLSMMFGLNGLGGLNGMKDINLGDLDEENPSGKSTHRLAVPGYPIRSSLPISNRCQWRADTTPRPHPNSTDREIPYRNWLTKRLLRNACRSQSRARR